MKPLCLLIFFTVFLQGCGGGSDSSFPIDKPQASSPTPQPPAKIANPFEYIDKSSTISGVDLDKNGVRDDIDRAIRENSPSQNLNKYYTQYARTLQTLITTNSTSRDEVEQLRKNLIDSYECLYLELDSTGNIEHPLMPNMRGLILNTSTRNQAYQRVSNVAPTFGYISKMGKSCVF